jgi:hypothetical protein
MLATLAVLASPVSGWAESAFDADTTQRALIVVDARVQRKSLLAQQESPILSGTLRLRTPGVRKPKHELSTATLTGVLVFAVEPGRYRPGSVTARVPKMQVGTGTVDVLIPLPSDSLRGLEHSVAAGALVYVGRIDIMTTPRALRPNDYRFVLTYSADRERLVWETLLDKGKPGAWEGAIQSRLDAITAMGDSMAAAADTALIIDPPMGSKR